MTYAVIDLHARTMTYARAGHTPLIYVSGAGRGAGGATLVIEDIGAHNRPGASHGVLQALTSAAAAHDSSSFAGSSLVANLVAGCIVKKFSGGFIGRRFVARRIPTRTTLTFRASILPP